MTVVEADALERFVYPERGGTLLYLALTGTGYVQLNGAGMVFRVFDFTVWNLEKGVFLRWKQECEGWR